MKLIVPSAIIHRPAMEEDDEIFGAYSGDHLENTNISHGVSCCCRASSYMDRRGIGTASLIDHDVQDHQPLNMFFIVALAFCLVALRPSCFSLLTNIDNWFVIAVTILTKLAASRMLMSYRSKSSISRTTCTSFYSS